MAVHIPKFPRKLEELLGRQGTDEYIDFFNEAFHTNKEDVVQVVGDRFERRLVEETSKLKTEIGGLRNDMTEMKAELKEEISGLRVEMKSDIALLHRDIANQTKWILVVFLAAGVLYPILNQIVVKFIH